MEQALRQLEYGGLDPKKRKAYTTEVTEIDTYDDELERVALEEKLTGLLDGFIDFDFRKISSTATKRIKDTGKLFPGNLVEEIGIRYIDEGKISQEQLEHFIKLLAENGILSD
jgi:hypothetical protein